MVAGFTSVGMDVLLFGPLPTPAVAMLTKSMRADLGVMISASHNLFEDNGIKLFGPDGLQTVRRRRKQIEQSDGRSSTKRLAQSRPSSAAPAASTTSQARYIEFAKRTFRAKLSLDGLRIVIDCANGAAYKVAPEALWELGADVITIGVEPDGFNINQECGSTVTGSAEPQGARNARRYRHRARRRRRSGHRSSMSSGHLIDGDQLLALIAQSWKRRRPAGQARHRRHRDVESRARAFSRRPGIELERTPVGDRYVLEQMLSRGYNVGGEQSGHIILSDYATTGDGLVAALQVLAVVQKLRRPVSEVCHRFDPLPQILKNVRYRSGKPLDDADVQIGDR